MDSNALLDMTGTPPEFCSLCGYAYKFHFWASESDNERGVVGTNGAVCPPNHQPDFLLTGQQFFVVGSHWAMGEQ